MAAAGDRIQEILDAAESVADQIRRDARSEAESYLDERRREADALAAQQAEKLESLLDTLRRELRAIERQGDSMVTAVEAALAEARRSATTPVTAETNRSSGPSTPVESSSSSAAADATGAESEESQPQVAAEEPKSALEAVPSPAAAIAYPGTGAGGDQTAHGSGDDGALIRATQMAVRGSDRAQIEQALRDEFAISDPAPIVDEILGRSN
jgi:hypothetical protein